MSQSPPAQTVELSAAAIRPLLHFTPDRGWMNDPNGLIEWNGQHHLYFQYDPDNLHQGRVRWGHASSPDLIHWTNLPDALLPGEPNSPYDQDGCFSGCAVVDDGTVALLYTGVQGEHQLPCLAVADSPDLERFVKAAANPIIAAPPLPDVVAFRDHSVFEEDGRWQQAVGGGTAGLGGAVFAFTGDNLYTWEFGGLVLDSAHCAIPGLIWECPDLFVVNDRAVLIVSILSEETHFSVARPVVWYATGPRLGSRLSPTHEEILDYGDRFYAPQSYWTSDHRRILLGWLRTDQDPAVLRHQSRGAMSLPRELLLHGDVLYQRPAREVAQARHTTPVTRLALDRADFALSLDTPLRTVEIEIRGGQPNIDSIDILASNGTQWNVALTDLPADPHCPDGPGTTLYFDAGIVEIFRDGRVATLTDLRLNNVAKMVLHRSPQCTAEQVTIWTYRR